MDPYIALDAVMPDDVRDAVKASFPQQRGADVADLLDIAANTDWGLERVEPWWEEHGHDVFTTLTIVAPSVPNSTVAKVLEGAIQAILMARSEPTPDGVRDLAAAALQRMIAEEAA